jgi:hypothetical protein
MTARNIRFLDALGGDEVRSICVAYGVGLNGRTTTRAYPARQQIRHWPRLGRHRRLLEMLYGTTAKAAALRDTPTSVGATSATRFASLAAALLKARQNHPTAMPDEVVARAIPLVAREPPVANGLRLAAKHDLAGELREVFDMLSGPSPLPAEVVCACAAQALAEQPNSLNDTAQIAAVLAQWSPLSDREIDEFWASDVETFEASQPGAMVVGAPLPPLYANLIDCHFVLELDTEVLALKLCTGNVLVTRGQVQTLLNDALSFLYSEAEETDTRVVGRPRRFFMGPVAASDTELRDDTAKTMGCLVYDLGNPDERRGFLAINLPRISVSCAEYACARQFTRLWEGQRGSQRPAVPEELRPRIDDFGRVDAAEREIRTRSVRNYYDAEQVPLNPDDLDGCRNPRTRHRNVDQSNPSAAKVLAESVRQAHLSPTELMLVARGITPSGALARAHLEDHPRDCADCREAVERARRQAARPDRIRVPASSPVDGPALADIKLLERIAMLDPEEQLRETEPDLDRLRHNLITSWVDWFAEAEGAARAIAGERFDDWVGRQIVPRPGVSNQHGSIASAAIEKESLSELPEAARAGRAICFQTGGDRAGYSLYVREVRVRDGFFTTISCLGPKTPSRWGFRLRFRPADERLALEEREPALGASGMGALRVVWASDPDRWRGLLDLLIPSRYGSDSEPEASGFTQCLRDEGVDGRLPGMPTEASFWVLDP